MTSLSSPAHEPRPAAPRRARRAFARLLATEARLFLREPTAIFWGVAFPVVLLVILGLASSDKPQKSLGGARFLVVYTPTVMVFALAILALSALPTTLAAYRDKGYLRRLATTPVGAWRLLAAELLLVLGVTAAAVVLIGAIARVAFAVPLPSQFVGFVIAIGLGAVAMLALGTLISALAPSQRTATVAGSMLFFPSMFFAGLWVPREEMGAVLRTISDVTPLGAAVAAIEQSLAGDWPSLAHLGVLAGWSVLLCLAAVRFFRWER